MANGIEKLVDTIGDFLGTSRFSKEKAFWDNVQYGAVDRLLYNNNKSDLIGAHDAYDARKNLIIQKMEHACMMNDQTTYLDLYEDMRALGNNLHITLTIAKMHKPSSM